MAKALRSDVQVIRDSTVLNVESIEDERENVAEDATTRRTKSGCYRVVPLNASALTALAAIPEQPDGRLVGCKGRSA